MNALIAALALLVSCPVLDGMPQGAVLHLDADNADGRSDSNATAADASVVTTWTSYPTVAVTGSQATVRSKPGLRQGRLNGSRDVILFDGSADSVTLTTSSAYDHVQNTGIFDFVFYVRRDVNRDVALIASTVLTTEKGYWIGFDSSGHVVVQISNGSGAVVSATTSMVVPPLAWTALEVTGDGSTLYISKDLTSYEAFPFTGALATGTSTRATVVGFKVGNTPSVTNTYFNGAVALITEWSRELNAAETAALATRFASRYGAQTDVGIVALGDSITAGNTAGYAPDTPWPMRISLDTALVRVVANQGIAGETSAQGRLRWTSQIRSKGYATLVWALGVNDANQGVSVATAQAAAEATMDEARADGMTVVVLTGTPCANNGTWNGTKQTTLEGVNTALRNYATLHSLTLVDTYVLLGAADPTKLLAAYDSGDGIHPSQAGLDAIAAAVKTALGL